MKVEKDTPSIQSLFNGSLSSRYGLLLHELLFREATKEPQAAKVITIDFTYTPEVDGKFLLLETSQTLAVRQRTRARTEVEAAFLLTFFFAVLGDVL